jgi:TalC/MipB family fructose-6-phosphate aldolase
MNFLIDSANINTIKKALEIFPISGVTCNPTIIKREGAIDFFNHFKEIRKIIGQKRSLHIQVTALTIEEMLKEAETILKLIDKNVFIKIPITQEGLSAVQILKKSGINVTATAIYTKMQGYLAIEAGADFIAPYFNRMENLNINPKEVIASFSDKIVKFGYKTIIVAASFKNIAQICSAFDAGAQAITADIAILCETFKMLSINEAVNNFRSDWQDIFKDKNISQLNKK